MTEIPLHWQTISELSRRIHNGSLSPVELMEHLLNRVETLDGRLHSFRLLSRERAMAAALASELASRAGQDMGPLHGIPYAVKDLIDVQGLPTTAGSNLLLDNIASTDATVVRRLTQAGMVLLGKANTVQFAFGAPGVNHHHGTPHNPWHATPHVPGGSKQWLWRGGGSRSGARGVGDRYGWVRTDSRCAVWHRRLEDHGRPGESCRGFSPQLDV
jgi:aspartyl-tRNA(Asn)/glutamyl-tRNA(Gln) amidotransferase subunit A